MLKSQKKNRNQDQRSLNRHESPYVLLEANTLSTDLQYAYNKWRIFQVYMHIFQEDPGHSFLLPIEM